METKVAPKRKSILDVAAEFDEDNRDVLPVSADYVKPVGADDGHTLF